MPRVKKQRVTRLHCYVGDSVDYTTTEIPKCGNPKCQKGRKLKHKIAIYQYGIWDDTCTEVFKCPICAEYTVMNYQVTHSVTEGLR